LHILTLPYISECTTQFVAVYSNMKRQCENMGTWTLVSLQHILKF